MLGRPDQNPHVCVPHAASTSAGFAPIHTIFRNFGTITSVCVSVTQCHSRHMHRECECVCMVPEGSDGFTHAPPRSSFYPLPAFPVPVVCLSSVRWAEPFTQPSVHICTLLSLTPMPTSSHCHSLALHIAFVRSSQRTSHADIDTWTYT